MGIGCTNVHPQHSRMGFGWALLSAPGGQPRGGSKRRPCRRTASRISPTMNGTTSGWVLQRTARRTTARLQALRYAATPYPLGADLVMESSILLPLP